MTGPFGEMQVPLTPTKRIRYRLYTEFKDHLPVLVSRYFQGTTLFETMGVWKGTLEASCVIEILATDSEADVQNIVHLVGDIKERGQQEQVLVTMDEVKVVEV